MAEDNSHLMTDEKTRTVTVTSTSSIHYHNLDADKVLSAFGKYGKYQMLAYFMTNCVHLLFAINMMLMPFITEDPDFSCVINEPDDVTWNYAVVDKCHIMDGNNWTVECPQIPGSSYDYKNNKYASIASNFDLVCKDYESVEHGSSVFLFGGMLAGPIITQLSDLYGRRITFLYPLYIGFLANVLCAVSFNYTMFLVFRFLSGIATTSFCAIAWVLCMESVSAKFRSLIPLMGNVSWVLGYTLAGVIGVYIDNWRWAYFAASIPGLLVIPVVWFCPESLHWLITKNKKNGVKKYIRTSSRVNGTTIALKDCKSETAPQTKKRNFMDILNHPALLVSLVINSFILIVLNGTYWALSLFSADLSDNKTTGFFLSGIVELPAGIIATVLMVYLNRKTVAFAGLFLTSLSMFGAIYLPLSPSLSMIFPLAAKVFNAVVWSVHPLIYGESTPTSVRNVFCGVAGFVGDIGGVLAPYLKRLESVSVNAPTMLIAVLSMLSAVFIIVLPETKDKSLPEDLDDFDEGPILRYLCGTTKETDKTVKDVPSIVIQESK